jgi:hypothetical protein
MMDNVFVIKHGLPTYSQDPVICKCRDPYTKEFNPDCKLCVGTGIVEYREPIPEQNDKRLSQAEIYFENAATIYGEDEEIPITDILAFFHIKEDVQVGDTVVHKGKYYKIVSCDEVVGVNNRKYIQCCLEPVNH